jgi:predicted DNA-binding ArsR family transcriptional regulator
VEETLCKSNDLFATFRVEMETMTLKTRMLEKDNTNLKRLFEDMNGSFSDVAEELEKGKKSLKDVSMRRLQLENLCRVC